MFDVVALGESLIDCTPAGKNEQGMELFSANPGGAPANMLAMNSKLGGKTAFIGKVGRDAFGDFLMHTMERAGIDVRGLCRTDAYKTTLAFVQLDEKGERSFSFYREPGADLMLRFEEVRTDLLQECRVFHFGSVSMTDEPCRSTTRQAVQAARRNGAFISYDPNYRPPLWKNEDEAVKVMRGMLPLSNMVKVSEEEMVLLTGQNDCRAGARAILELGPCIVLVTMGEKGSFFSTAAASGFVPAAPVQAVDTTGAGDAFLGALLAYIRDKKAEELAGMPAAAWREALCFANAAGGLTTTRRGAIPAMPDRSEIEQCMQRITGQL